MKYAKADNSGKIKLLFTVKEKLKEKWKKVEFVDDSVQ